MRILLIEDNEADIVLVQNALLKINRKLEIDIAKDGQEALDYLDRCGKTPVLILLDLSLPKFDGFHVLEQVKADRRLRHIPIVILSGSRHVGDISRAYELNCNAYVPKPDGYADLNRVARQISEFWFEAVVMI